MVKKLVTICGIALLVLGLSGCGASYEGSGSKDAASAEQLALRTEDPWAQEITVDPQKKAEGSLIDGTYVGVGKGMDGLIVVTLLVNDNRIACIETVQGGETQSVGGYEAIRDGKYASMIDAAQGSEIDTISGATITTNGVKEAVESALEQAASGKQSLEVAEAAAKAGSTFAISLVADSIETSTED